jgi:hypothetical protein
MAVFGLTSVTSGAAAATTHPASAGRGPLAVVTGLLPSPASTAAPATIYVYGVPQPTHMKPGEKLSVSALAWQRVTTGSSFRLMIPDNRSSAAVIDRRTGRMNIQLDAFSPQGSQVWSAVARVGHAAAAPGPAVTSVGRLKPYSMGLLRRTAAATHTSPMALARQATPQAPTCDYGDYTYRYGIATRIGELHAASSNTGTYSYTSGVDSTFTVGFSGNGSGWSVDGNAGVTHTSGEGEAFNHGGYYSQYVDGKYDYEQWLQEGDTCQSGYFQVGYQWDGSAFPGYRGAPGRNINGQFVNNCTSDPTNVPLPPDGSYAWKDQGTSYFWSSGISSPWGAASFSFGGSTGYSSNVKLEWKNDQSSHYSWLCGPNNDGEYNISSWDRVYDYNS